MKSLFSTRRLRVLGLLGALLPACLLGAQSADLSANLKEEHDALLSALEGDTALSQEQKDTQGETLGRALAELELIAQQEGERTALQDTLDQSAATIARYEARVQDIQGAPARASQRLGRNPSLATIEGEISALESQRSGWNRERKEALEQLAAVANTNAELSKRLAELSGDDQAPGGAGSDVLADRIAQFATAVSDAHRRAERDTIELTLRNASTLNRIRSAKIAWLDAVIEESDTLLEALHESAASTRQSARETRRAEIRRALAMLAEPRDELRDFGARNLALIDALQRLNGQISNTRRSLAATQQFTEDVQQDANLTRRRLEVTGLETQLGEVMISRLASLPDVNDIIAQNRGLNERIAQISISAIDTEEYLRAASNRADYLAATLGRSEDWTRREQRVVERLYEQRRQLYQDTLEAENTLLRLLVDENQYREALVEVVREYDALLTGNLLWVRNYDFAKPERLAAQFAALGSGAWRARFLTNWPLLLKDPLLIALLLVVAALMAHRRRILAILDASLGHPIAPRDASAGLLLRSLLLSLFAVSIPPTVLVASGVAMRIIARNDVLTSSLGEALITAGAILGALRFFARLGGRLGAGSRLLKWNSAKIDAGTRDLPWFTAGLTLASAAMLVGRAVTPTESGGALAAISSLCIASLLAIYALRLVRSRAFANDALTRYGLRAVIMVAAAIMAMHFSGQLFAAHLYLRALNSTLASLALVLFVVSVLQRLVIIYRFGLERRARKEQRDRDSADAPDEDSLEDAMDAASSLSDAYKQLLGLFRLVALGALLWLNWSPALPALDLFDSVVLWTSSDASLPAGERRDVTLSLLLFAALVLAITLFITRRLPPLLNVLLMEWTAVTPGSRYALGMFLQYLTIGIGISYVLVSLGFQWVKVQWLVAALGVGIGFGLQEIVANFISGLIVLFERPIRVGDVIETGEITGTVVHINPRATVVETFENKEVMIPNKDLITGKVTNWSLTTSRLRIVVPVGIAYGSDVDDAIARLEAIAEQHPEVLDDPEPFVTFEDFGDNALVLWLRCYALEDYLRVGTELRQRVYRNFNAAGIDMAFPQRDIHLDAQDPLPIRIVGEKAGS